VAENFDKKNVNEFVYGDDAELAKHERNLKSIQFHQENFPDYYFDIEK